MYAHCNALGHIDFSEVIPLGDRLIAQGDESILRQAVAATAVQYDCGWQLPEGTPDEQADAIAVFADSVALLSQEKAWNEKHPVGTVVIVETIARKETRSGLKIAIKVNKRKIAGRAVVMSGAVLVPVWLRGKRILVPMSSIHVEGAAA